MCPVQAPEVGAIIGKTGTTLGVPMIRSLRPAYQMMMMSSGTAAPPAEFISIHNTALRTGSTTILLPFSASTGNRTIDWGDGVVEVVNTANPTHTYAQNGVYTVTVRGGTTTRLGNILDAGWQQTLTEIVSWGKLGWTSFEAALRGCTQDVKVPTYLTSTVTTIRDMFRETISFNQSLNDWDTKNITNMRSAFFNSTSFNQSLDAWNVSNVNDMTGMFSDSKAFNQNLGAWQLRRAGVNMTQLFAGFSNTLSVENYSRTLIGWANYVAITKTPATVTLGATGRKYNATVYAAGSTYTNAVDARAYLVTAAPSGPGWTITDGGLA